MYWKAINTFDKSLPERVIIFIKAYSYYSIGTAFVQKK